MSCNTCMHLTYEKEKGFYCVLDGENKKQTDSCGLHEPVEHRFSGKLSAAPKDTRENGALRGES